MWHDAPEYHLKSKLFMRFLCERVYLYVRSGTAHRGMCATGTARSIAGSIPVSIGNKSGTRAKKPRSALGFAFGYDKLRTMLSY